MHIFLTGGTGFVGTAIRAALVDDGHAVMALTRHACPPEKGVTWVTGDIADSATLAEGMRDCTAVVHMVGIIRETRKATFQSVHVDGTRHILDAMADAGITRLLHMSALGAGPKSDTAYYRTKWEAEEIVRASGIDFTIFRPSIIFGRGDGFVSLLAKQVRLLPVVPIIGTGRYPLAPIAIRAVATACVQALRHDDVIHRTIELCGPDVLTYEEIVDLLMAHLRRKKAKLHIPVGVMRFIIGTAGVAHLPLPITADQLAMLLQGNVCADSAAHHVFDLPIVPLRDGIAEYIHP